VLKVTLGTELEKKNVAPVLNLCAQRDIPVDYLPKAKLQILCGAVVHQGFVALLAEYKYLSNLDFFNLLKSKINPFILILDQIQDTHNLGAIIRTAESVNLTALVMTTGGGAEINATVAKTSAGAVFHCPIHRTEDLITLLENLKSAGLKIIGTVRGREKTIYHTDFSTSLAVVVGSEGKGIRKNILLHCDEQVSIPMYGRIDSLNVSVSTAVVLYEIVRQRSLVVGTNKVD
jgi:23S rRNA (guanosine2251-2'-O)-methyltransferase